MTPIKGNIKIIVIVVIVPPMELPTSADLHAADLTREDARCDRPARAADRLTSSVGAPREIRVDGTRGGIGRGGPRVRRVGPD